MSIKCRLEGCNKARRTRGLCSMHYQQHLLQVQRGEVTWQELEDRGIVLPAKSKGSRIWERFTLSKKG